MILSASEKAAREREDMEIWLASFKSLPKHPSTGQRTDEIREEEKSESNHHREDLKMTSTDTGV